MGKKTSTKKCDIQRVNDIPECTWCGESCDNGFEERIDGIMCMPCVDFNAEDDDPRKK